MWRNGGSGAGLTCSRRGLRGCGLLRSARGRLRREARRGESAPAPLGDGERVRPGVRADRGCPRACLSWPPGAVGPCPAACACACVGTALAYSRRCHRPSAVAHTVPLPPRAARRSARSALRERRRLRQAAGWREATDHHLPHPHALRRLGWGAGQWAPGGGLRPGAVVRGERDPARRVRLGRHQRELLAARGTREDRMRGPLPLGRWASESCLPQGSPPSFLSSPRYPERESPVLSPSHSLTIPCLLLLLHEAFLTRQVLTLLGRCPRSPGLKRSAGFGEPAWMSSNVISWGIPLCSGKW